MNKMMRILFAGLLILFTVFSVNAADTAGQRMPWDAPIPDVPEGAGLITVGFWADVIGYGLIVAGGMTSGSIDFEIGVAMFNFGSLSLTIGNICLQQGLTTHQKGAIAKGYTIIETKNAKIAGTLSFWALLAQGGGVGAGIAAAILESTELAITSFVLGAAGAVVEIINFYIYRKAWGEDLKKAVKTADNTKNKLEEPEIEYTPVIAMNVDKTSGELQPFLGIKIAY